MADNTKGDILNRAFSALRISGITVDPSPSELVLAINKLESMAAELIGRNICTNYYFEDEPDPNTPHNMERKFWHSFDVMLAVRLMPDFGKGMKPDVSLIRQGSAGFSFLSSATAKVLPVQYPSRMPRGSGITRYRRWRRFHTPIVEAPNTCKTNRMTIGDIDDFIEHFDSYLIDTEEIDSYTIEADTGLTIVSDSDINPDIFYQIKADGGTSNDGLLRVKIVMTTNDGRITTRVINFELTESIEIE
jgi:hypothetical protein